MFYGEGSPGKARGVAESVIGWPAEDCWRKLTRIYLGELTTPRDLDGIESIFPFFFSMRGGEFDVWLGTVIVICRWLCKYNIRIYLCFLDLWRGAVEEG